MKKLIVLTLTAVGGLFFLSGSIFASADTGTWVLEESVCEWERAESENINDLAAVRSVNAQKSGHMGLSSLCSTGFINKIFTIFNKCTEERETPVSYGEYASVLLMFDSASAMTGLRETSYTGRVPSFSSSAVLKSPSSVGRNSLPEKEELSPAAAACAATVNYGRKMQRGRTSGKTPADGIFAQKVLETVKSDMFIEKADRFKLFLYIWEDCPGEKKEREKSVPSLSVCPCLPANPSQFFKHLNISEKKPNNIQERSCHV